jgi:hypothetical protein
MESLIQVELYCNVFDDLRLDEQDRNTINDPFTIRRQSSKGINSSKLQELKRWLINKFW